MPDTLDIFGKRYTGVTGIIATDSGGSSQKIYFKVNGTWVETNEVYKKVNGV